MYDFGSSNRRNVLKTIGVGIVGGGVLTGSASAKGHNYGNGNGVGAFLNERAQEKESPVWDSGVADRTGEDTVEVNVGTIVSIDPSIEEPPEHLEGVPEEGPFGFEPRAVEVSPGTTVRWVWTGNSFTGPEGNLVVPHPSRDPWPHDVVSLDEHEEHPIFHSEHLQTGSYAPTGVFDETGTYLYYCSPHGNPNPESDYEYNLFGMRGAVIVTDE